MRIQKAKDRQESMERLVTYALEVGDSMICKDNLEAITVVSAFIRLDWGFTCRRQDPYNTTWEQWEVIRES